MQADHRSRLLSVGRDDSWLLSKTGKERKRPFMTFYCKSTHMDFCRQDSTVPRTVRKHICCSVLWLSLATAGGSEKQVILDPKILLSMVRHQRYSAVSHHHGRIPTFICEYRTAITLTFQCDQTPWLYKFHGDYYIQGPVPQQIEGARQKLFEQLSWVTRVVRQDSVHASNQDLSLEGSYLVCWHA